MISVKYRCNDLRLYTFENFLPYDVAALEFHQSISKHRRRTFLYKHDERTGMQRATLGKSGSEAASQLQGRIARAFSSNSLVNTMEMAAAIQYISTVAQSLGSRDYYKKSRMTILGLAGELFCENEQG